METQDSLTITAELKNLSVIHRHVEEAAKRLGADPQPTADMLQAVEEAATNVIVHGYRGQAGTIEIRVRRQDDQLVVVMRDRAPLFDPTQAPPPDLTLPLEERGEGGYGIYLMKQFTDQLVHSPAEGGGNELIMVKTCVGA